MRKKFWSIGIILVFLFSFFKCLIPIETVSAEVNKSNIETTELSNTENLYSQVSYYQEEENLFWTVNLTKKSSLSNRQVTLTFSISDSVLTNYQVKLISDNWTELETGVFQENEVGNEEKEFKLEIVTPKRFFDDDQPLKIAIKMTEENESGDQTTIVDSSNEDSSFVNPKKVFQEESSTKTNSVVSSDQTNNLQRQESIPENPEDKLLYPTISNRSFLQEIQPYFANTSLYDPFSYLTDALGMYPASNSGTGQGTEVRNYNYAAADTTALITGRPRPPVAKNTTMSGKSWDFTTGYHQYSGANQKKWVEPVKNASGVITDPTLFNVYLEVIGDANVVINPVDIILVLDKSSSMNELIGTETKDDQVKKAVKSFVDTLLNPSAGLDVRIGLVNFGSDTIGANGGTPVSQTLNLTSTASTITNSTVLTKPALGSTPTDLGLVNGLNALYGTNSRSNADKLLVFLSDGAPTRFYKPVEVRSRTVGTSTWSAYSEYLATNNGVTPGTSVGPLFNYDGSIITANEKYPNKFYSTTGLPQYSADGKIEYQYQTTNPPTWLGTGTSSDAANVRKGMIYTLGFANYLYYQYPQLSDVSFYSIGMGISDNSSSSIIGRNTLKNLSRGEDNYYSANEQGDLLNIFTSISSSVVKTVQFAHLVDPLGTAVSLVGEPSVNSFSVTSTGTTAWSGTASADPKKTVVLTKGSNNTSLEWSGINLGKDQGLRFTYQVQLKDAYQSGLFQQVNGETYLENGTTSTGPPYDTANRLHFAIPSVRYKKLIDVKVKKVWNDVNNDWQLRTPVVLRLQRSVDGGTYQDVSGKTFTIQPSATGSQLENTFTGVEKFDATGKLYTYRVLETSQPDGYIEPVYSDQNLTVTNTLLTNVFSFKKYDHDGTTPLVNVTFELTGKSGKKVQATSDSTGTVSFGNIPSGTYTIAELTAPTGYQTVSSFKVTATKTSDTALSFSYDMTGVATEMYKITGQQLSIINRYERGKFTFKKVGNDGTTPLSGVSFSLIQNGQSVKDATSTADGTVLFDSIYPGSYTLRETVTQNGYMLLNDLPITVSKTKTATGELTVTGLPANQIVKNQLKTFDLSINKISVDGVKGGIKDAEFSLYYNGTMLGKAVSDATGKVTFAQPLEAGKNYTVKETAVPAGYLPIKGTFTIQVKTNGQIIVDYEGTVLTEAKNQLQITMNSGTKNNAIQYTVTNDPKRPLPKTGGLGILSYLVSGMFLWLVTFFTYYQGKKEAQVDE